MRTTLSPDVLLIAVLVVALPVGADAQQSVFVQALSELTAAIEGTYGDEGASVGPALDRMSSALAEWDRAIDLAAAGLRDAPPDASPASVFDKRVSLGRMYADRGRLAEALSEFDAASRLDPQRSDVHVLRGLVLRASGKRVETLAAFRTAWAMDRGDPVTAYYLFHEAAITGNTNDAREAAEVLAASYSTRLSTQAQRKGAPFARVAPLHATAAGPPVLPLAAYRQAYTALARGEHERAIAEFRKAAASDPLVTDPVAASAPMIRAVGALRQGRLTEARSLLEQSSALTGSSEANRALGLVYWAESAYDKSLESLAAAIRLSPRDERARGAFARVLSSAGRDADAERALEETLRVLPDSALAHWWLASTYERGSRFADARREFEQAAGAAVAGESQLLATVGRFAAGAADFPGAIDAFSRAVSAHPNDPAMHKFLAGAFMQQDRAGEAFAEFVAALLIDPGDAGAHAGIGQIYMNTGRYAEAVAALRRATSLSVTDTDSRYALATALTRLGNTDEAAREFTRVEQEQRLALTDRRRSLSLDVVKGEAARRAADGDYERAIEQYEKAITLGADPLVYRQLAELYSKVGRNQDAARARAIYESAGQGDRTGRGNAR